MGIRFERILDFGCLLFFDLEFRCKVFVVVVGWLVDMLLVSGKTT